MLDNKSIEIFSSRDRIRNQIVEMAKDYLEVESLDFNKYSYMSYLIDILSVLTSNLMFYNTSVYREFFLTKAIQKESVINLSSMLGYNVELANSSSADVLIEIKGADLDVTTSTNIVLDGVSDISNDSAFSVYTKNKIQFSLKDKTIISCEKVGSSGSTDCILAPDGNYYLVSVEKQTINGVEKVPFRIIENRIQFIGEFSQVFKLSETYSVPTLRPYEFYQLNVNTNTNYHLSDINVKVKTEYSNIYDLWTYYQTLFLIPGNKNGYSFKLTDGGIQIIFGNGIVGKQPISGSSIIVELMLTNGLKGNVISGTITTSDPIYYSKSSGGNIITKSLTPVVINKSPAVGGKDLETVDEIRSNAISKVSSREGLVSSKDFKDMNLIVKDVPFQDILQVLKRSDLRGNDISIFTDLIYENQIVPTKNGILAINETSLSEGDNNFSALTEFDLKYNETDTFVSLFDLNLIKNIISDSTYYTTKYSYLLKPISIYPTLVENIDQNSFYYDNMVLTVPSNCKFEIYDSSGTQKLKLTYSVTNVAWENYTRDYSVADYLKLELTGDYVSPGNLPSLPLTVSYVTQDSANNILFNFEHEVDLEDVYYGNRSFSFALRRNLGSEIEYISNPEHYYLDDSGYEYFENKTTLSSSDLPNGIFLNKSSINITIKEDLSDKMFSRANCSDGTVYVYDVPLIKKSYYDAISTSQKEEFEQSIYQRFTNFDISEYKMITDFINVKVSNTYGNSINMKYNTTTKLPVDDIFNITTNSSLFDISGVGYDDEYRIAFTGIDKTNPWYTDSTSPKIDSAYVATLINGSWIFEELTPNDIFSLVDSSGTQISKYLYTGYDFVIPEFTVPITISTKVLRDPSYSGTDDSIVLKVKENIINKLFKEFGYDKSIYRSQLIDAIQTVPGVKSCTLLKPTHDIFFSYNIFKEMSTIDLMEYSPELIYTLADNISVEIKR